MNKIYEYLTKIWIYEYKIQCKMKNMNNKSYAKCTKKVWIVVWIGLNVSLNKYESRFIFIHTELLSESSLYLIKCIFILLVNVFIFIVVLLNVLSFVCNAPNWMPQFVGY